ncbi:RAMP superfamily CRISPR-associated protein [Acrocarpospora catenulata]|uniref:RAMP superfamily CRISPR-associated protein n=1 Tax=Acrocarpospora catenulata TaxID=2836182 RepID=UPI001BD96C76|nr:RAMP superfamily CRISPR-associated protein [Acrocarpospora catenulata]
MIARVGRRVTSRIRARGWLRTESPLHVGGLGGDPAEPLPIAVDGLGRVYVPGTTLAGVLRNWCRGREQEPKSLSDLWGYTPDQGDGGRASRVFVADALAATTCRLDEHGLPATPLDPALLEFRPFVGIDRSTGTAAPEFLYGRAVVPAGCYLRLEIDIESTEAGELGADLDQARMVAILAALGRGEIRLGAATSRGFGSVRLLDDPLDVVVDRLDTPEGLLAVLRDDPMRRRSVTSLRSKDTGLPERREVLEVSIDWRPLSPVMVRGTSSGLIVDTLPLTTRVDRRHLTLVLPGSSLKGALRGHAEFVELTARGLPAGVPSDATQGGCAAEGLPDERTGTAVGSPAAYSAAFRAQLDRLPAVRALFGAVRDDDAERRAGALRVEECQAEVTIPETLWRSVTGADTPPVGDEDGERKGLSEGLLDRLEGLGLSQADHVALDRWTGGAADGRLFHVLEPHAVDWAPIRLSVDLTRLGDDRDHALALLFLTLRDLSAGRIPLGALVNRGFGDIEVKEITLTGGGWTEPISLPEVLASREIEPIAQAWTDYVTREA